MKGWALLLVLCGCVGFIAYNYNIAGDDPVAVSEPAKINIPEPIEAAPEDTTEVAVQQQPQIIKVAPPEPEEPQEVMPPVPEVVIEPEKTRPFNGEPLLLSGYRSKLDPRLKKSDEALDYAFETDDWDSYRDLLLRSLMKSVEELGIDSENIESLWEEEIFYQALLRWKVLSVLPPTPHDIASEDNTYEVMYRWILNHNEVMEEIILTVTDKDDIDKSTRLLGQLWRSHEEVEQAQKYFNLALATALVFDRNIKYKNTSGSGDYNVDYFERYKWYVDKNESGRLETSIHRLPARELCFVVCSPVSEDELDWALREFRSKSRKSWGSTYGEIEYLMERAVSGLDPYDEYTLQEIQKEGGICGDQTYFCVNTARAAGIPAFGLNGLTDSGGHAWAAVKIKDDEWSTDIGRIKGVSQGKGNDPQTGDSITEQEVWMWSTRDYQNRKYILDAFRLIWLSDAFKETGHMNLYGGAIMLAHKNGKSFPEIWVQVYQLLTKDPRFSGDADDALKLWKKFAGDIKREFKDNPRMAELATKVEDEHIHPHDDLGEIRRQLARDRRAIERESAEQTDLMTSSLKREADILLKRDPENALREIGQLYDRALRDYGGSLSSFGTMAEDYFAMMKGDEDMAKKAVRDIELAYNRVVESGTIDWFRAGAEVDQHKRICRMYREIGEEKRAELLEKRMERRMERAERAAD